MIDHTGIGALGLRRVMQIPQESGLMPVGFVPTIRSSGSIAFILTA